MVEKEFVKDIPSKSEDFSAWYTAVIRKAGLADYTSLKGCMVIKPYGFALWENVKNALDKRIKETGHQNAYFPLFIPESLLKKEAEHVEGFAPEVAWVTHGGKEELEERLAVRPTSEAIICSIYSKWVRSYRDLPILINQWANVVRWEKVTRLFLRTTEFLWQEGHTVHRTKEEAQEETLRMLNVYKDLLETELAIPVISGQKTEREKFAGALKTYSIEALMGDGKALQAGTSHNLGQHFAKVFDIKFLDEDQKEKYAWQTSWGVSTRLIGAIIMVHGDDYGLILPPKIAPIQSVIVPIFKKNTKEFVLSKAREIKDVLKGIRVELDDREEYTPGWKFNEWELKGVPLRIEIGPRDIEKGNVVLVRRDTRKKVVSPIAEVKNRVGELLDIIQNDLFLKARRFVEDNTHYVEDYGKFKKTIEEKKGFIIAPWCGSSECEEKIKEETKATIRNIPLAKVKEGRGKCIYCGKETDLYVYFARAY